jgi:hypothetical protein
VASFSFEVAFADNPGVEAPAWTELSSRVLALTSSDCNRLSCCAARVEALENAES